VGVESGTPFTEVEFEGSDGEWVDYDEKVRTSREIIDNFYSLTEGHFTCKVQGTRRYFRV
jgi:hypothetical protein